jgi:4-amino-4-deoxychorismate lyase
MASTILVNGSPGESISALDRGLAYGDGVFRTVRVKRGRALNWPRHYDRLRSDAALLSLRVPEERTLVTEIASVAPGDAVVKVIVTRGASGRGYAFDRTAPSTRVVAAFPVPAHAEAVAIDGVRVRRCDLVLSRQPRYAGAKTLNRLENVLARAEWSDPEVAEGLLADEDGLLIEGTVTNVFVVRGGRAATPDLSRCGVTGAQRERVRDFLARERIPCEVRDIPFAEVLEADELFLTNSLIGAWPVACHGGRRWARGEITRRIQALIEAEDA